MAQQVFSQYVSLARTGPNPQDTIPVVAAIAQTRDGKDELLLGNVPFVPGPGGLYVPVSASNRLPVEATLSGRARVVAMGLNEVIPPGVEIFRPAVAEAPVIQAHRRYGFILTFVATPTPNRRVRVNLLLRRLRPDGSKDGSPEYILGNRVNVLVADGSPGTPVSLIMEPVHVPAEWINFGILNTGAEDVTTNWYIVEV